MVKKYQPDCTASCLNCDLLNECITRPIILGESECCDLAKEGCIHYQGSGEQTLRMPLHAFINRMRKDLPISEAIALEKYLCGKSKFYAVIRRINTKYPLTLTEQGYIMPIKPEKTKKRFDELKEL